MSAALDRRALLRMIAGGAALAASGCSPPDDPIYPYVDQPEGMLPGTTRRYATALPLAGYLRGATGLVTDGRPVKLEGLAGHPASLGATDLFTECAILDLYDPQRLRAPQGPRGPSDWTAFASALHAHLAGREPGGVALLTGRVTSPTLLARIAALPGVRHIRWEPFHDDPLLAGTARAFGAPLVPRPRLRAADVVLSLGADPLGPGPEQVALAHDWSRRRTHGPPPRLHVVEPSLTATGAMADRRAAASPRAMALACHALVSAFAGNGPLAGLDPAVAALIAASARDLQAARGRALILVGAQQPASIHAFAAWANAALAAPLDWIEPPDPDRTPHDAGLAALAEDMRRGAVHTLIVTDANPVYAASPELGFAEAMARVPFTAVASMFGNETGAQAQWRLPLSHPLEAWSDGRAPDGSASIAQPLIRPLHDSRSAVALVDLIGDPAGGPGSRARVRENWAALDDDAWRAAVAGALVPHSAAAPVRPPAPPQLLPPIPARGLALELRPSPTLWDGRHATNAWAQECPDPITHEIWGASVRLARADMDAMRIRDGALVEVARGVRTLTLPARAVPGQARGVATLVAGYGRSHSGAIADGIGGNAWSLAGNGRAHIAAAGGAAPVATTQHHFRLEGELAKLFPLLAPGEQIEKPPPRPTLVGDAPLDGARGPQWAMAIDTDLCIGCNACVVACQAENNVPAIGPAEMARGRDMHWLRIDRYELGEDGRSGFQPVPCMQCEKAPCEPVCPVEASVHDHQGLNVQVYNRCIGTRTCQANCPYKVRRFNFFDYAEAPLWGEADAASVTAQRNPDVSVRTRGVMEKCTYCVQRISAANRDAAAGGAPVSAPVTACQAACPTRAISFGDLSDPEGEVVHRKASPRHYALLEELGTRPRTTYLARVAHREDEA